MEDELVKTHVESEDGKTEVNIASMDIEPSVGEDNKMIAPRGDTDLEPYEGMEFESEEAARTFYAAYARRVGFRIRISRYTRSRRDNSIISRRIVCSKEGFREARANEGLFGGERRQRQRAVTRVGCKAMIMVKKLGPEKWIVTKFVKEHNHGPVPPRKVEVRTVRRDDDLLVQSYISDGGAVQEPYEGMEFDSEEAAKLFYITYARHMGFRARISKYCRSRRDNSIISRQIVCSKEGFREVRVKNEMTDEGKIKRPRVITRIGCKAMIIVKKATSGKWVVTKFEKEHNHALTSLKMPRLELHSSAGKANYLEGAIIKPNGMVTDESCAGTQGTNQKSLTVLYNQLCYEAIKYAQEGAATEDSYNVAMSALKEAVEKVAAAKKGAVTVAQQGLPIGGAKQAFLVAHPAQTKALQDLQSLNEVRQVPLILNIANGQLLHNPSDGLHVAQATQVLDITNAASVLKQSLPSVPSMDGLTGNGSEGSDSPAGRKMTMKTVDRDVELDAAVQKSQNWDSASAAKADSTPRTGNNLTSPGSSESQMVAIPAVPVTLYMPVMGGLAASCSVATPGTPGGSYALVAAPIEALPLSSRPAALTVESPDSPFQPAASQSGVLPLTPSLANLSDYCKSYTGPNPQVHATAIACGARVVPPKAAAPLIKAIEARIRSGGASIAKSAFTGGCKLLSVQSPQPCAIEEGRREPAAVKTIPGNQAESLEDMKLREDDAVPKDFAVDPDNSVAGNAGQNRSPFERQAGLLDTVGAAEDLCMFEKRAWTEIKCD